MQYQSSCVGCQRPICTPCTLEKWERVSKHVFWDSEHPPGSNTSSAGFEVRVVKAMFIMEIRLSVGHDALAFQEPA